MLALMSSMLPTSRGGGVSKNHRQKKIETGSFFFLMNPSKIKEAVVRKRHQKDFNTHGEGPHRVYDVIYSKNRPTMIVFTSKKTGKTFSVSELRVQKA